MALKCYTRKKNNGGNYTNCVDDKGKQMREKDKKKVVKKQPVKRKKLVIVNNVNKPKVLPVDKKPVISVASGAPGTKTPFKAKKPVKSEAMREADEALDDVEEALMRNVLPSSVTYLDEGSAEQQANEAIAMMKLATTPKPKKKLAPAKMRTVKVGKAADDKIKKMLGNVSETNSALSSSAPTKRDVMRERIKRRVAAREQKKQAAPGYKEKQAAMKSRLDDYDKKYGYIDKQGNKVMAQSDQDELMRELMN